MYSVTAPYVNGSYLKNPKIMATAVSLEDLAARKAEAIAETYKEAKRFTLSDIDRSTLNPSVLAAGSESGISIRLRDNHEYYFSNNLIVRFYTNDKTHEEVASLRILAVDTANDDVIEAAVSSLRSTVRGWKGHPEEGTEEFLLQHGASETSLHLYLWGQNDLDRAQYLAGKTFVAHRLKGQVKNAENNVVSRTVILLDNEKKTK